LGVVTRAGLRLSTATGADEVQTVLSAEPSVPKRPSFEGVHRLGAGFSRITSQDLTTGGHLTLQAGWEGIIGRRFLIGFDLEADWLASSLVREDEKRRSQRLLVAGRLGPRIEMPFNPGFPVPFAIQPYAQLGVTTSRAGERTETLSLLDPGCDMATEACAVDAQRETDWTDWRWAPAFGGGVRFDMKRSYIDVGVTTNPWDTRQDTRFVVGLGLRFSAIKL
ncbi:MAG: hypothetical protein KDA24_13890, partial [Deltaproteobacteria bacterium]|nr:hypothetical protein [Deltaproteobacteria bacterium]